MKKLLALVLALVMVLGLCACGGKGGASGSGEGGGELTADGRVKLTLGLPTNAYIMDYDDNALTRWIEEKCGVELEAGMRRAIRCPSSLKNTGKSWWERR